jgi:2-polyprenyl-3-methyl-5-hydroxy-6-metoxy-1,4-benzoquinol methylase/Zn ribbon nucleic-acid-binding protein
VHPAGSRCPACGAQALSASFATPNVQVSRCRECGHRVACHTPLPPDDRDYHEQFEGGAFLESLRDTRRRQATIILARVRQLEPDACRLLDLGCGRGWFVESALQRGFAEVAGADTSPLAVGLVRDLGAHAILLSPEAGTSLLAAMPFRPQVLTLLDLVEHFEGETAVERLSDVVDLLRPELRLVVVKVPVSTGVLYRAASGLRALGAPSALEQLYQVGTTPPHHHYFTPRSARTALRRAGLSAVAEIRDVDFEPVSLTSRARAARKLPAPIGALLGNVSAATAALLRWHDSLILLARPDGGEGRRLTVRGARR